MSSAIRRAVGPALLSVAIAAASAHAQVTSTFSGTTVGGPTWNRPLGGTPPVPPPSGVGSAVAYQAVPFTVATTGNYDLRSFATVPLNWDNYAHLYINSFSPTAQFTNILRGNDDFPSVGTAGFGGVPLTAGTTYIFVTSGFANTDAGAYRLEFVGPGAATFNPTSVVPEPSTYALLATGLAALAVAAHRRRA